ncbi:MAG: hypothetical protein HOM11_10890 [Methylococcales bacterium]|jgi:hypothetical protein|nr:hypothetical protein [Methylococcales bacterium]MBT7442883.1 hypothetical protein [Methylococcales bacterium]
MKLLTSVLGILLVLSSSTVAASDGKTTYIPEAKTAKSCTVVFRRDVLGLKNQVVPIDVRVKQYQGVQLTISSTFVSSDGEWLVLRDYRIPKEVILFVSGC